jgi:hypothetical protein
MYTFSYLHLTCLLNAFNYNEWNIQKLLALLILNFTVV